MPGGSASVLTEQIRRLFKRHGCCNSTSTRRSKSDLQLLNARGNGVRVVAGMDVIPAPSWPRPRPSYVLHAFLDRHLGDAFYDLMEE